jgi:hypothetical protein
MNDRQRIAYAAPCARAHETLNPDFRRIMRWKGMTVSSIVTVNK